MAAPAELMSEATTTVAAQMGLHRHGIDGQGGLSRRSGVIALVVVAHVVLLALLLAPRWVTKTTPLRPITVTLMERPAPPVAKPVLPAMEIPVASAVTMPMPDIHIVQDNAGNAISVSAEVEASSDNRVSVDPVAAQPAPPILSETEVDYLYRPRVDYPQTAKRLKEQGIVLLLVLIDEYGRVADLEILHSTGSSRLDQSAMRALKHARFRPYRQNGVAIPVQVRVPVEFSMKSVA